MKKAIQVKNKGAGSVYMYADDTTVFCLGHMADEAIANLNKALQELYTWCLVN